MGWGLTSARQTAQNVLAGQFVSRRGKRLSGAGRCVATLPCPTEHRLSTNSDDHNTLHVDTRHRSTRLTPPQSQHATPKTSLGGVAVVALCGVCCSPHRYQQHVWRWVFVWGVLLLLHGDAVLAGDDDGRGHVQEQAVLHHTHHLQYHTQHIGRVRGLPISAYRNTPPSCRIVVGVFHFWVKRRFPPAAY